MTEVSLKWETCFQFLCPPRKFKSTYLNTNPLNKLLATPYWNWVNKQPRTLTIEWVQKEGSWPCNPAVSWEVFRNLRSSPVTVIFQEILQYKMQQQSWQQGLEWEVSSLVTPSEEPCFLPLAPQDSNVNRDGLLICQAFSLLITSLSWDLRNTNGNLFRQREAYSASFPLKNGWDHCLIRLTLLSPLFQRMSFSLFKEKLLLESGEDLICKFLLHLSTCLQGGN